jgi:putative acetyltransferase
MIIRKEIPSDSEAITAVTKAAFTNHPYSRNTEHLIIHALRAADVLTVSLVAEEQGQLVGHIAFSPITFTDGSQQWVGLGPVSVRPDRQKQGIGSKLVNEGLRMVKEMGAKGCVLVGDPDYYQRFGFKSPQDLKHEGVPPENLLALAFNTPTPTGTVEFHPAFFTEE